MEIDAKSIDPKKKSGFSVVYFRNGLMGNTVFVKEDVENPEEFIEKEVKPYAFQYIIVESKGKTEYNVKKYKINGKGFINQLTIATLIQTILLVLAIFLLVRK